MVPRDLLSVLEELAAQYPDALLFHPSTGKDTSVREMEAGIRSGWVGGKDDPFWHSPSWVYWEQGGSVYIAPIEGSRIVEFKR